MTRLSTAAAHVVTADPAFRRIVDTSVHPSCILEGPDHDLSVFGGDLSEISTSGQRP